MDDLISFVEQRIKDAASAINGNSLTENDVIAAEAVETLSRALSYLYQIKRDNERKDD